MRFRVLWMILLGSAAVARADMPVPLAPAASSPPELAAPEAPVRLEIAPGEEKTRYLGKCSAERPATILIPLSAHVMATVGVSSPGNVARIMIYEPNGTEPLVGTTPADGAIRWTGQIAAAGDLRVVVVMPGAETPFRIEANWGPGGM